MLDVIEEYEAHGSRIWFAKPPLLSYCGNCSSLGREVPSDRPSELQFLWLYSGHHERKKWAVLYHSSKTKRGGWREQDTIAPFEAGDWDKSDRVCRRLPDSVSFFFFGVVADSVSPSSHNEAPSEASLTHRKVSEDDTFASRGWHPSGDPKRYVRYGC